ncbi:hypothetical protein [Mesorhizobium sp.]|uniref:hypothetical protein n=1 Tax=Mesorhizobium sp. TaxID=1871066 RepID=UPI00120319F8|nr:hypothetical protein [Mesorhizobium sp.]TJV14901.1 MAG: hypothetical protein E5Y07_24570 [Mesorhizobium sp.]
MSVQIKAALIVAGAILPATAMYLCFSPYQSCVRAYPLYRKRRTDAPLPRGTERLQVRKLVAIALALMPVTSAFASDTPGTVYVQNTNEKSAITAHCDLPVAGELKCHFTQMTVSKPDDTQAETRIANQIANLLKAPASELKGCDSYPAILDALEAGKAPPDVTDKKAFDDNWGKQPPEAKADTIKILKALAGFCTARDRASAEAMARAGEELDSATCRISNWTFDRTFTYNVAAKRWQSTVQNTDSCGTIDYGEFSRPPELKNESVLWNYMAKTIVTNPNGKNYFDQSCSTTDQTEHRYTWQTGKFYANCRYLQLSP